jgi:hypothetical protein
LSALPSRFLPSRRVLLQRLEDWLLRAAQVELEPDCGAVVGSASSLNGPEYLYPEVTGYYLTWLAFLRTVRRAGVDISVPTRRAASWLARQASAEVFRTRCYPDPDCCDWRNAALFSFDLAMACRGIAAVREFLPASLCNGSLGPMLRLFSRLCPGDGTLVAALPHDAGDGRLPSRWSTRPGPYQLKPAAAILGIPAEIAGTALRDEMKRVYHSWRDHYERMRPDGALHPLLYHLEGLVLGFVSGFDSGGLAAAGRLYPAVLRRIDRGCLRSDVVAQTLRLGCLIADHSLSRAEMSRLGDLMSGFVDVNGATVFRRGRPDAAPKHWNTWSAIFAHQGFTLLDAIEAGRTLPPGAGEYLA